MPKSENNRGSWQQRGNFQHGDFLCCPAFHLSFILLNPVLQGIQDPGPHLHLDGLLKTQGICFVFSSPWGNLCMRVLSQTRPYTNRQTGAPRPAWGAGRWSVLPAFLYLGTVVSSPALLLGTLPVRYAILCPMECASRLASPKPLSILYIKLVSYRLEGMHITDRKAKCRERGAE